MKHSFVEGDYIDKNRILNDEQFRAVQAVCGETEILQHLKYFDHSRITLYGDGDFIGRGFTLSECLFNSAPDWVVDLRLVGKDYRYTDGVKSWVSIDGGGGSGLGLEFYAFMSLIPIIATRDLPEPATVDADDWYDGHELPPVGLIVELFDNGGLKYAHEDVGKPVEVIHNLADEGVSVVRLSWGIGCFDGTCFRPLGFADKQRDEWVEYANKTGINVTGTRSEILSSFHDGVTSGELKCPCKQK